MQVHLLRERRGEREEVGSQGGLQRLREWEVSQKTLWKMEETPDLEQKTSLWGPVHVEVLEFTCLLSQLLVILCSLGLALPCFICHPQLHCLLPPPDPHNLKDHIVVQVILL